MSEVLPFPRKMRARNRELLPNVEYQAALVQIIQAQYNIRVANDAIRHSADCILVLMKEHGIKPALDEWAMLASAGVLCAAIKSATEISSGATDDRP